MKIVQVDKVTLLSEDIKRLKEHGEFINHDSIPSEKEGVLRIKDADIVIDNWFEFPAHVIQQAPKLKMICVAATGYEWVDLDEARKRNIIVCNAPDYSLEAVAEHSIGLMLDAIRFAGESQRALRNKKYDPAKYIGKELYGKTLGIIGYGRIGRRVGEIARNGFGMKIMYVNSSSSRKDLENLLKKSDVISINAKLTENTRNMIGDKEFGLMKGGVTIVNAGRGAIIDENAFVKCLGSGKIFAAGLDVLAKEPMDMKCKLFNFPNVTITPHIAYNTEESTKRLSRTVANNVINFVEGHPQNIIS